MVYKT